MDQPAEGGERHLFVTPFDRCYNHLQPLVCSVEDPITFVSSRRSVHEDVISWHPDRETGIKPSPGTFREDIRELPEGGGPTGSSEGHKGKSVCRTGEVELSGEFGHQQRQAREVDRADNADPVCIREDLILCILEGGYRNEFGVPKPCGDLLCCCQGI